MLSYLAVRGLALLEDARLELSPGFNVLTGETGAGKSMIVDGLGLVHGARGQRSSVRDGKSEIEVDAEFAIPPERAGRIAALLAEHGLPGVEAGALLLQRSVPKSGRSRCFVQGRLTTLPVLARIGAELIEITSQHEHQSLTLPAKQLGLLDAFAELEPLCERYAEAHRELCAAERELSELTARAAGRLLRTDLIAHQLAELEKLSAEPGERQTLAERVALLSDARRASELAAETRHLLAEDEQAALPRSIALAKRAARAATELSQIGRLAEALERACAACEDAVAEARSLEDAIDAAPGELEAAEERLAEIDRLCKKHGVGADDLAEVRRSLAVELETLSGIDQAQRSARERERSLRDRAERLAAELHEARIAAAARLAERVSGELAELCMPLARLEARLSLAAELGPSGKTRLELLLAANPGEPAAPLGAVASGGELSRLLLAFRSAVLRHGGPLGYVFDEVDAGVGGRVAEAIGVRLAAAARHHQVLAITHLPQIAAFASAHFRVEKIARAGRTITRVERLEGDARLEELARMLGGAEASARTHARGLLEQAVRSLSGPLAPDEPPGARTISAASGAREPTRARGP